MLVFISRAFESNFKGSRALFGPRRMGLWRGAFIIPHPLPGEDASRRKGAVMGTERLSSRLQHGGVKASLSIPGPFLQLGQASGLWLCCLSTPRAAAPSPRQRGASPPLTGSFCGTHVSSIRAVSGKTLPAAFDLQATWLDAPSTSWDAAASVLQCCCFCWGLCWLPGPVCSQSTPGAAGAHGAAPALEPPTPVPIVPFLFVPWVLSLGASLLVLCPSLTWRGKISPIRAMPSSLCRAGTCPAAMVLLHLRA